ncbi:class II glutamine amidotransferase, partial [Ostertagia ostertagi]
MCKSLLSRGTALIHQFVLSEITACVAHYTNPEESHISLEYPDEMMIDELQEAFGDLARACNVRVISWRKLGTNRETLGEEAKKTEPLMRQVFVTAGYVAEDPERFDRNVYLLRKLTVNNMAKQMLDCYICSLSTTTIVYK